MTCCTLDNSFKARLKKAERWYINQLIDPAHNTAEDYKAFGDLLMNQDDDTPFYCYVFNADASMTQQQVCYTPEDLVSWLVTVDHVAATERDKQRFTSFNGGHGFTLVSEKGEHIKSYILQASFNKR
ncbi:TPA: hypothetical protein JLG68_001367 [Escherichia coli]|nr:hypothetical protein [Escherichia coli]